MVINLEGVVSENWQNIPAKELFPGIRQRILWRGSNGAMAQILEIDPGAKFTKLDTHFPGPPKKCSWYLAYFTTVSTIIRQVLSFTIPMDQRTFLSQSKGA